MTMEYIWSLFSEDYGIHLMFYSLMTLEYICCLFSDDCQLSIFNVCFSQGLLVATVARNSAHPPTSSSNPPIPIIRGTPDSNNQRVLCVSEQSGYL